MHIRRETVYIHTGLFSSIVRCRLPSVVRPRPDHRISVDLRFSTGEFLFVTGIDVEKELGGQIVRCCRRRRLCLDGLDRVGLRTNLVQWNIGHAHDPTRRDRTAALHRQIRLQIDQTHFAFAVAQTDIVATPTNDAARELHRAHRVTSEGEEGLTWLPRRWWGRVRTR